MVNFSSKNNSVDKAGFNAAFLDDDRSEQIFTYHLKKLGINRILDIGSNTGQFATKLRSYEYDGVIYSVEPQRQAFDQLLYEAKTDMRWVPLARQGAGAEKGFLDLNISENSWSSSVLEVHPNHVRAEITTRTIGTEKIYINTSGELLRPEILSEVEALKIDVQGFEEQVIKGYLPFMPNIKLLLLELSLVECYKGAPDLFDLDRWLVNELSFSRVSLEPSYYDEIRGVVQQYDGIYYKPDQLPHPSKPLGLGEITLVTSIGGSITRTSENGEEVGKDWFDICAKTWARISDNIYSVSEQAPQHKGITWLRTEMRPSVAEILKAVSEKSDTHIVLTNADISLIDEFRKILPSLDPATVYYGARLDGIASVNPDGGLDITSLDLYPWGFDFFILPPAFVNFVIQEQAIPEEFKIGQPWWDFLLPVVAMAYGFPVKKLHSTQALAVHLKHEEKFSKELWFDSGAKFITSVRQMMSDPRCVAKSFLSELAEVKGSGKDQLNAISKMICNDLP